LSRSRIARFSIVLCSILALAAAPSGYADGKKETKDSTEQKKEARKKKGDEPVLQQSIVVSATRSQQEIADVPVSTTVLSSSEIEATPVRTLDDLLRNVAGVDIPVASVRNQFPGSNRLSMRGLAGNRAALALIDGIPLNDGYTGAVLWKRIPTFEIQQIEVVRGANASLFGNYALGGTINVVTRDSLRDHLYLEASTGSFGSVSTSLGASRQLGDSAGIQISAEHSGEDGFIRAPEGFRGPVDIPSANHTNVVSLRTDWQRDSGFGVFARTGWYKDYINLGTSLGRADTEINDGSAGIHFGAGNNAVVTASIFAQHEKEYTDNARPNSTRTSVYLANQNRTRFDELGGSAQWTWGGTGTIAGATVGLDVHDIDVTDPRRNYSPSGATTSDTLTLGKQRFLGLFGVLSWAPTDRTEFLFSGRVDRYRNSGGVRTNLLSGDVTRYDSATTTEFNPRISFQFEMTPTWSARAAVYRGFQAPKISALFWLSEVGSTTIIGNPNLGPEILTGGEVGLVATTRRSRTEINLFDSKVSDLQTRVVVATVPRTTLQDQNIGSARSRGVEVIESWTITPRWIVLANYSFTDSVVTSNPQDPALVGNRVPHIPRHAGSASLRWIGRNGLSGTFRARSETARFYDAENLKTEGGALILDLLLSWRFDNGIELYVSGENLLDRAYVVDQIAGPRRGVPAGVYGGVRFELGSR